MFDCPKCNIKMIWQSDFTCEDVAECKCENGLVSFHLCGECERLYTYTSDCDYLESGLEQSGEDEDQEDE